MQVVALLLRVALALIFGTAGAAKLADLDASRDTVEAFGIPVRMARFAGAALPFAELLVAVALLIQPTGRWGAAAGVLLLVVFSGGVAFALSRGQAPDCNCFGQLTSEQIGPRTLARNALFALFGVVVLAHGAGDSLGSWTTNTTAANLVAGVAVICAALSGYAGLALYRTRKAGAADTAASAGGAISVESVAAQITLSVGDPAPEFTLPDFSETEVSLGSLRSRGLPVLLVFASPICGPCQRLLPQLARWSISLRDKLVIAVVESTVHDGEFLESHVPVREELVLMYEPGFDLSNRYGVSQTPTAILISADGRLDSVPHTGAGAIERLVRSALKRAPGQLSSAA